MTNQVCWYQDGQLSTKYTHRRQAMVRKILNKS